MSTDLKRPTEVPPSTLLAPEEPLFRKYSQQHEFPLSTLISVVTHGLVALIAFLAGAYVFNWAAKPTTPEIHPLVVLGPEGGGGKAGIDETTQLRDPDVIELKQASKVPEGIPVFDLGEDVADMKSRVKTLQDLGKQSGVPATDREKLSKGAGGGDDGKTGTGKGPSSGPGGGTNELDEVRPKRMERWILSITYQSGTDYLNKLANLQAVLAVPEGKGRYRVYTDLSRRPFQSQVQATAELEELRRIYWTQTDSATLLELAKSLDLPSTPRMVHVFFPHSLEQELLKQELRHAKLTEQEINERKLETKFRAERRGNAWVVTVLEQKPRN
jgi:hypothetical protein